MISKKNTNAKGISSSRHCVNAGFKCDTPDGAYYVMADISDFGFANDIEFTKHLIREIGVAVVPGSSFYQDPFDGITVGPILFLQNATKRWKRRRRRLVKAALTKGSDGS